jgi:hypothetical protein
MSIDPKHSLQLAFQHLDAFSVPGVGTFKRTYFGAVIDHRQKKIMPPAERFVLQKGDSFQEKLVDFYFRHLDLKIDRARELAIEVGNFVIEELKKAGRLLLPGWGELRKAEGDAIDFVHEPGSMGSADHFFGLQPVGYTLGEAAVANDGKKEAAALAGQERNITRVESPPPPRRKRKGRGWIVLILLLLLLGSGAGIIWPDRFMKILHDIGLMKDDNGPIASKDPKPPVLKDTTTVKDMEPVLVDPTGKNRDSGDRPGEYAVPGTYYLIVSATLSGDDARKIRSRFRTGGVQPTIIKTRSSGGYYKIAVFHSTDKDKVIEKMVDWKDKFPDKSWIYWAGM